MTLLAEPLPDLSKFVLITYIIISVSSLILLISHTILWRNQKTKSSKKIFLVLLTYSTLGFIMLAGFYDAYKVGYRTKFHNLSIYVSYFLIIVCYKFLLSFVKLIFSFEKKEVINYNIILGILSLILILPNNYYGLTQEEMSGWGPNIRPFSMSTLVIITIFINIRISIEILKYIKQIKVFSVKIGLFFFLLSQIFLIICFLLLLIDAILLIFNPNFTGYSVYFCISFLFNALFPICMFLSLIIPRLLWKSKKNQEKQKEYLDYFEIDKIIKLEDITIKKEIEKDIKDIKEKKIIEEKNILITCPICQINKKILISKSFVEKIKTSPSGLSTLLVKKNMLCEHQFLCFVDHFLDVRSYEKIDHFIQKNKIINEI